MSATLQIPNRPEPAPTGVRTLFERCADAKADATLLVDVGNGLIKGSFEAIDEYIAVLLPHSAPRLPTGQAVALTFVLDGRWSAVLSRVERRRSDPRGWLVELAIPRALQTELRRYPRIRVGRGANLRASVAVDEQRFDPLIEDLSLGGAFITFTEDCYPDWERGTLVRIRLVLGLANVSLIATVVRQAGSGYGLAFNRFSMRGGPEQEQLQQLITELEIST